MVEYGDVERVDVIRGDEGLVTTMSTKQLTMSELLAVMLNEAKISRPKPMPEL